jgi:hypothetical protein
MFPVPSSEPRETPPSPSPHANELVEDSQSQKFVEETEIDDVLLVCLFPRLGVLTDPSSSLKPGNLILLFQKKSLIVNCVLLFLRWSPTLILPLLQPASLETTKHS